MVKSLIMDSRTKARFEARAKIMKALAHPTRLFIVDQLSRRERCVNELTGMVGSDMSTISKHLSVLKNAGIIIDEKRGLQVYYKLKFACVLNFFGCIESMMELNVKEQSGLVR